MANPDNDWLKFMSTIIAASDETLIPKSLDEVIRANRDRVALRHASEEEIMELYGPIRPQAAKGRMENWHLIALHDFVRGHAQIMLLGDRHDGRGPRITSNVEAVDLDRGYVVTQNSLYQLGKGGQGEPSVDQLIMVCLAFHGWGFGGFLGVPQFY